MLWLWNFFLKKREFTLLLSLALIAAGAYSLLAIPKESAPEVVVPIGIVTTSYIGAAAADIEELVTNPIEDVITNVDNVDRFTSTSQDDVSVITVEFETSVDIDKALQDLKDAVDRAKSELPDGSTDPLVSKIDFSEQPFMLVNVSSNLPPVAFTALGESLEDELKSVKGVSDVSISGIRDTVVRVEVESAALVRYGISISDVVATLARADLSVPVGQIENGDILYALRVEGDLTDINDLAQLPISTAGGVPVLMRDIAKIYEGQDRLSSISRVSVLGEPSSPAISVSLFKKAGADVTTVASETKKKLNDLQAAGALLDGSQVLVVYDQGTETKKELIELVRVGGETVLLVMVCLLLTIGWRESIVAALSIPLSFVIAFIGLYASGNTINFISLFALILAIGILVDSGIVITEAIHTRMREYKNPDEAAYSALREYAWPLIGGTMTTVAVFAPLFFLSGVVGEFIASIPFTLIFVLLASIFVALGIVPLMAIYLTKESSSNRFEEWQEVYTLRAQAWYREHLISFLERPKAQRIFLWSLGLGLVASFILPISGLMQVAFFPNEDADLLFIEVETREGTPIEETDLAVRTIEEILYDMPVIAAFTSTIGSGSSFTGSGGQGTKYANITLILAEDREVSSIELASDLRQKFSGLIPNTSITISEQQSGPPSGAPVLIKLRGDDQNELFSAADQVVELLASIEGTRDVTSDSGGAETEVVFRVDRAKAAALGVAPSTIGEVLRTAVFGTTATTISKQGEDIDVVVQLMIDRDTKTSSVPEVSLDAIKALTVPTMLGGSIPLSSVIKEDLAPSNASILHEDGQRLLSVSAYTTDNVVATEVISDFTDRVDELTLPESVTVSYGGETEDVNQSFKEMFIALIAGLFLMLAILVLSFNSIRYAFYLLLAVPYSLIGVFFGLTLTGLPLSFTSLLGVIALAGVIVNHAIILMDSMITRKASIGSQTLIEAVADAAVSRLRPIVLTTVTTVVGMIPLSTVSALWSPLAYAIMFGLTFAMLLTLVLIPTLYYRHEKKKVVH